MFVLGGGWFITGTCLFLHCRPPLPSQFDARPRHAAALNARCHVVERKAAWTTRMRMQWIKHSSITHAWPGIAPGMLTSPVFPPLQNKILGCQVLKGAVESQGGGQGGLRWERCSVKLSASESLGHMAGQGYSQPAACLFRPLAFGRLREARRSQGRPQRHLPSNI